jgi:hypothetical protein
MDNDLISRDELRDIIEDMVWYSVKDNGQLSKGAVSGPNAYYKAEEIFEAVDTIPPAMPMKEYEMPVLKKNSGNWNRYYCPMCGRQQKNRKGKKPWYCERCGQKLGKGEF